MRFTRTLTVVLLLLLIIGLVSPHTNAASPPDSTPMELSQWEVYWESQKQDKDEIMQRRLDWQTISWEQHQEASVKPPGVHSAWYKIKVPILPWDQAGMLLRKIYGFDITVLTDKGRVLYDSARSYSYDINRVLVPLESRDEEQYIYMHIEAPGERFGIQKPPIVGEYQSLIQPFVHNSISDIVLGSSFVFLSVVMLICGMFLRKIYIPSWIALGLVILSVGVLIISNSPFTLTFYSRWDRLLEIAYLVAMLTWLPSISYFFEKTMGLGCHLLISVLRRVQIGYSLFCLLLLVIHLVVGLQFYSLYFLFTVVIQGILMIIHLGVLIINSIKYARQKHKDAILFTIGFATVALFTCIEYVWYLLQSYQYELWLWKWGVLVFVLALVIILGRTIATDHERVSRYSRELELYNNEMQHYEKLEMISELAASVAHEVRNPLQVTRGFLQLMGSKAEIKERNYLNLALEELDRASAIITDFLTFAKPEANDSGTLCVAEELKHIEGIMLPMANMQGALITLDIRESLCIEGNSSKFKQAFLNLVKNSIEALTEAGEIHIWAYAKENSVYIHIRDNGVGMTKEELARLGEPYYSKKNAGTGLGLVVTFRIVDMMKGTLKFKSELGHGTECVIQFPLISNDHTN